MLSPHFHVLRAPSEYTRTDKLSLFILYKSLSVLPFSVHSTSIVRGKRKRGGGGEREKRGWDWGGKGGGGRLYFKIENFSRQIKTRGLRLTSMQAYNEPVYNEKDVLGMSHTVQYTVVLCTQVSWILTLLLRTRLAIRPYRLCWSLHRTVYVLIYQR